MCNGDADAPDMQTQIADYMNYINGLKNSCDITALAKLLHATQDAFSPAHRGFQCWRGTKGESVFELISHGVLDLSPSNSTWSAVVSASSSIIEDFKKRCPCDCQ
jgi:hypothetical protein